MTLCAALKVLFEHIVQETVCSHFRKYAFNGILQCVFNLIGASSNATKKMYDRISSATFFIDEPAFFAMMRFDSSSAIFRMEFRESDVINGLDIEGLPASVGFCSAISLNGVRLASDSRSASRVPRGSYTALFLHLTYQKSDGKDGVARFHTLRSDSLVISICSGFDACHLIFQLSTVLDIFSELSLLSLKDSTVVSRIACWVSSRCNWSILIGRILGQEISER